MSAQVLRYSILLRP